MTHHALQDIFAACCNFTLHREFNAWKPWQSKGFRVPESDCQKIFQRMVFNFLPTIQMIITRISLSS